MMRTTLGIGGSGSKLATSGIGGSSTDAGYSYTPPSTNKRITTAGGNTNGQLLDNPTANPAAPIRLDNASIPMDYSGYSSGGNNPKLIHPYQNSNIQEAIHSYLSPGSIRVPDVWKNKNGEFTNGFTAGDRGLHNGLDMKAYQGFLNSRTSDDAPGITNYLSAPRDDGVRPGNAAGLAPSPNYTAMAVANPNAALGNGPGDPRNNPQAGNPFINAYRI